MVIFHSYVSLPEGNTSDSWNPIPSTLTSFLPSGLSFHHWCWLPATAVAGGHFQAPCAGRSGLGTAADAPIYQGRALRTAMLGPGVALVAGGPEHGLFK